MFFFHIKDPTVQKASPTYPYHQLGQFTNVHNILRSPSFILAAKPHRQMSLQSASQQQQSAVAVLQQQLRPSRPSSSLPTIEIRMGMGFSIPTGFPRESRGNGNGYFFMCAKIPIGRLNANAIQLTKNSSGGTAVQNVTTIRFGISTCARMLVTSHGFTWNGSSHCCFIHRGKIVWDAVRMKSTSHMTIIEIIVSSYIRSVHNSHPEKLGPLILKKIVQQTERPF